MLPAVPTTVMNSVLYRYRRNGTSESDSTVNISPKFPVVQSVGNSLGGNAHSSWEGLKALPMISTIGSAINTAITSSTRNTTTVPARE